MDTVNMMGVVDIAHRVTIDPEIDLGVETWRDEGRGLLLRTLRRTLMHDGPAWAEAIDDDALLDPLLVTTLQHPDVGLDLRQCLWGLVPPDHRPSSLLVRAFEDGRVVLPGLGTLRGPQPYGRVTLCTIGDETRLREYPNARLEPLPRTEGLCIYPFRHPWLRPHLDGRSRCYADSRVAEPTRHNLGSLTEALQLLAMTCSRQHAALCRDVRLVVVVRHPELVARAPTSLLGAMLLGVRGHESPVFFVEELAARGAAAALVAAVAGDSTVLVGSPDVPAMLTEDEDGPRSLGDALIHCYGRVHAITALESLLAHPPVRGHLRHEVLGRLAFSLMRLEIGLRSLGHPELVSARGSRLHLRLVRAHDRLERRLGWVRQGLDVSDQPPVFDYRRFLTSNPR